MTAVQNAGLSTKADFALSNLNANGGALLPEQNDTFIRKLMDVPTILKLVRTVPMSASSQKVNKIGFGSRVLVAAPQGTSPYLADTNINSRWLGQASRVSPFTQQISLTTSEVMAEIQIPYEVLEDNIERGGMADTILQLIAERAALDLEELLIKGDTSSSDPYLALQNGILKLSTSNVVDAGGSNISVGTFNNLKKALPTAYRRNLTAMRFFSSVDRESDYRVAVASRGSALGDSVLTSNTGPLPVLGVPLMGAALMPNSNIFFTDPQNILFGIQRNIRIEQTRDIRARQIIIVLTARIAIQIEEELAVSKVINLA
jgi:HK97 family phage major capsid protein